MSSAAVGTNSGGTGSISLMSCVRESSPLQDYEQEHEKHVASKRRFWNPKKWFKRKNKATEDVASVEVSQEAGKDPLRSRSTSELSVDDDQARRRSSSTMHPGLSVSHDSVFHPLSSDAELDAAQSSSSLSASQPLGDPKLQTELGERLRLRRLREGDGGGGGGGQSEDDEGLPRSPCNSPTAVDHGFLTSTCKDLPTKSHSTCSDGSLLSMGSSSDIDEDSLGLQSRHPSKLSLHEKRADSKQDWDDSAVSFPLNHSAAHHKVAIRPKKNYGAPRRRKGQLSALPATPEVNEESSIRSVSPEVTNREAITELYSDSMPTSNHLLTEKQLKCFSLPPGLAPPSETKLNRSKSNAGSKSDDPLVPLFEKEEKPSLFERIFPRKSGKKKKKEEKESVKEEIEKSEIKAQLYNIEKTCTESTFVPKKEEHKPLVAPRSGAIYRQRIQPMEIPVTPKELREPSSTPSVLMSPEKSGTSPVQAELEQILKQKQISVTSSRSEALWKDTPPQSPKTSNLFSLPVIKPRNEIIFSTNSSHTNTFTETKYEVKNEDIRHKIKIGGLSALQQRVLSLNDDDDDETDSSNHGYKSLTDFSVKRNKPLIKSHSFKSSKRQLEEKEKGLPEELEEKAPTVLKAASLDSFRNLEDTSQNKDETVDSLKAETVVLRRHIRNDDQCKESCEKNFTNNDTITISGPSHTAVVNVRTHNMEDFSQSASENEVKDKDGIKTYTHKENQVSITKIQLKHETTKVTKSSVTIPKSELPEFLSKQLNKVEMRPTSNIVFSMKPKVSAEEQNRPKTLFSADCIDQEPSKREMFPKLDKQSAIESPVNETLDNNPKTPQILPGSQQRFRKNEKSSRKSSLISVSTPDSPNSKESLTLKHKSMSLDSLKSDYNSEILSSQDSLDKLDNKYERKTSEIIFRKKSPPKQKNEDEPELMKVFARRSLKLKESDVEQIQEQLSDTKNKDSDKENSDSLSEAESVPKEALVKDSTDPKLKEPLGETKRADVTKNVLKEDSDKELANKKANLFRSISKDEPEVELRKPHNIFSHRSVSLNPTNTNTSELVIKKQSSFADRRITDQWISNVKNDLDKDRMSEEVLTTISNESDFIEEELKERKNFRQRKAEWEKRAQLSQKKTPP